MTPVCEDDHCSDSAGDVMQRHMGYSLGSRNFRSTQNRIFSQSTLSICRLSPTRQKTPQPKRVTTAMGQNLGEWGGDHGAKDNSMSGSFVYAYYQVAECRIGGAG